MNLEKTPFLIAIRKIKYSGINIIRNVQNLDVKNLKHT